MEVHSFVGHGRTGKHYDHGWQSRDNKDIDCKAIGCMFNLSEKCRVPSRCKITDDGRCEGFSAKPLSKIKDGD